MIVPVFPVIKFLPLQDSHGRIWVGTSGGGLNLMNKDKKSFTHFTMKNGMANNKYLWDY